MKFSTYIKSTVTVVIGLVAANLVYAQSGVIAKRLDKINSVVALDYNAHVETAINKLILNEQESTSKLIGLSIQLLPAIEDSFVRNGLPTELRFLAPALSRYDQWLVSEDGGSGIWQLRYLIAKQYGINISSYIDDRRDVEKSTAAAIKYLKDLHKIYGDWLLTIAAFCADEVEVNKAIRMAGNRNYWEIHRFLPARFQQAVPGLIASVYMHSYYQMHNIIPVKPEEEGTERVQITQWTTIYQISQALEVDYEKLKNINAVYKKQVIPNTQKEYYINIPFEKVGRFYSLGDSVYTFGKMAGKDSVSDPNSPKVQTPVVQEPESKPSVESAEKALYYTVKKGDYLGRIADLYDVNISDLRRWNGIRGDNINVNQRLKIVVSSKDYDKYSKINGMSAYQKQQLIDKD